MQYVDVLIGNEEDAKIIFGYEFNSSESKVMNKDEYASILKSVYEDYSAKYIFFTLRESISANKNYWSSICFNGKEIISSTKYDIDIIDRLGAGDSFSAGVIFGLLNEKELNYVINFATAFSCLKHTVHGDFNLASILETEALMNGDSSGRIMR
jgi:2-dehydro-3-deoxygluconokinase